MVHRLSKLHRHCLWPLHAIKRPITTCLVTFSNQVQLVCRRWSSSAKSFNSNFSLAYCIMYNTVFSRGGVFTMNSIGCSLWSEMFAEALLYVMPNCIHFLHYSLYLPIWDWMVPLQQLAAIIIWRLHNVFGEWNRKLLLKDGICPSRIWYAGGLTPPPAAFNPLDPNSRIYISAYLRVSFSWMLA